MGSKPLTGIPRLIALGLVGGLIGGMASMFGNFLPITARDHLVPAAYRTAKFPDGTALRMAMVHDVIHERYLRHSDAWYAKRNEKARAIMDAHSEGSPANAELFDAMDDLAVGLDHLHQDDEAAKVMEAKLKLLGAPVAPHRQIVQDKNGTAWDEQMQYVALLKLPPLGEKEHAEYTAEANLGTVMVHGSFAKAAAGDATALARLRQGLAHIERSIEINPLAHFGRENWQAIAIRHFLAAHEHPEILTTYTMIGEEFDDSPDLGKHSGRAAMYARNSMPDPSPERRASIREFIPRAGINPAWAAMVQPAYRVAMPFDEPVLGLIGMWTLGGGPNPHSALALGHIMEAVGQREIAWNAYERAVELGDGFSRDTGVREKLVGLCQAHQHAIARVESPRDPDGWERAMRSRHVTELAFGREYQQEYQAYEEGKIRDGFDLKERKFYHRFFSGRENIASDPGLADDLVVTSVKPRSLLDCVPLVLLGAGVTMLLEKRIKLSRLEMRSAL